MDEGSNKISEIVIFLNSRSVADAAVMVRWAVANRSQRMTQQEFKIATILHEIFESKDGTCIDTIEKARDYLRLDIPIVPQIKRASFLNKLIAYLKL